MAMVYINYQEGIISRAAQREADLILPWTDLHVLTLSAIHIPGMEDLKVDLS